MTSNPAAAAIQLMRESVSSRATKMITSPAPARATLIPAKSASAMDQQSDSDRDGQREKVPERDRVVEAAWRPRVRVVGKEVARTWATKRLCAGGGVEIQLVPGLELPQRNQALQRGGNEQGPHQDD